MFNHIFVGSNDLARSKIFYDATFAAMGADPVIVDDVKKRLIYRKDGAAFIVAVPINGEAACIANGGTIGFKFDSPEAINAWHAAGLAHGGTTAEDPPGVRPAFGAYLAYLRDPDGHKLCALHMMPK